MDGSLSNSELVRSELIIYFCLFKICNLNAQQLLKMGVSLTDTEKIIDNVSVLKQTMQGIKKISNHPK